MTAKQNETLGRRIARMRLSHGMTQERLANIANVSAQAVSKWENDQSYPDILLLPVLAKTFGVTVDELLGIESVTPEQEAAPEPTHVVRVPIDVDEAVEATTTVEVATEPDVEGIDLVSLARGAQNAGRGTLIDVDDGHDRVIVTLE